MSAAATISSSFRLNCDPLKLSVRRTGAGVGEAVGAADVTVDEAGAAGAVGADAVGPVEVGDNIEASFCTWSMALWCALLI